jgi:hypothetical protein
MDHPDEAAGRQEVGPHRFHLHRILTWGILTGNAEGIDFTEKSDQSWGSQPAPFAPLGSFVVVRSEMVIFRRGVYSSSCDVFSAQRNAEI